MPQTIKEIEKRFLEVSGLKLNLSVFPLKFTAESQVETDKAKSASFGEVFTPLWLVDKMIKKVTIKKLAAARAPLDLCAGYGQFTIRMMRALANYDPNFDCDDWLSRHTFVELQLSSCYKLLYIFGININLFMGDATQLNKMRSNKGIFYFNGDWCPIKREFIAKIIKSEEIFVREINKKFRRADEVGVLPMSVKT